MVFNGLSNHNGIAWIELGPLHKNRLPSLLVIRVTTHSKIRNEWQHTQKGLSTTTQENVYKKIMKDQAGRMERSYIELK
jgi:hypothetical protein